MKKIQFYLREHKHKIWEGKDGQWYTYLYYGEERRLIKRGSRSALEKVIASHYEEIANEPTFIPVFWQWLNEREEYSELRPSSVTRYENDLMRFFPEDEPFCQIKMINMTDRDLELFLKRTIKKHQLTKKGYSGLLIILKGVFRYAKREKYTQYSISTFLGDLELPEGLFTRRKKRKKEEEVFNDVEASMLIRHLWSNPTIHNLGLILMFETGLRVGELAALRKSNILEDRIVITGTEVCYRDKETNKRVFEVQDDPKSENGERTILLPESAKRTINAILRLCPDGEYLFMKDGKRIISNYFNRHLERACKKIGIPPRSAHKIRKTYATHLIDANVSKHLIMEQMGHSDITTTEKYYYFNTRSDEFNKNSINNAIAY